MRYRHKADNATIAKLSFFRESFTFDEVGIKTHFNLSYILLVGCN